MSTHKTGWATLTHEEIDAIFEAAQHQTDYLLALYRQVIPDFDHAEEVQRWPACSKDLWCYICEKAMAFDRLHHTSLPGGLWLNSGFSSDEAIKGHRIRLPVVTYKTSPQPV